MPAREFEPWGPRFARRSEYFSEEYPLQRTASTNLVQNGQATSRAGGCACFRRPPDHVEGGADGAVLLRVTPIGFLLPTAKRFLESEPDRGGDSYWVKRDPTRRVNYEKPC
jgi:hypothetical protein